MSIPARTDYKGIKHSLSLYKKAWTWLEEKLIFSIMRGDILLLNVNRGAAIKEVCLWSKNLRFDGFSGRKPHFE